MNVTFRLPSEELEKKFAKEATAAGLDGLKGHRSVGGMRASIYNAFPESGRRRAGAVHAGVRAHERLSHAAAINAVRCSGLRRTEVLQTRPSGSCYCWVLTLHTRGVTLTTLRAADQQSAYYPLQRELDHRRRSWWCSTSCAVAAFLFFSWTEPGRGAGAALDGGRVRHQPGLPPAAHASRLQDVEGVRVLPGGLRHADARGRARSSGSRRTACTISTPTTTAIRIRRAKAASGRTWAGSSSATRTTTTPS